MAPCSSGFRVRGIYISVSAVAGLIARLSRAEVFSGILHSGNDKTQGSQSTNTYAGHVGPHLLRLVGWKI